MQNPTNPDGTPGQPPPPPMPPGPPPGQWSGPPPPPPQDQWSGRVAPPQGQWGAPPPPNNTVRNVLLIVGGLVLVLCLCAAVYSIFVLSLVGGQVNNIFSTIASSLVTVTP